MSIARKIAGGQSKAHFTVLDIKRQSLAQQRGQTVHEKRSGGDLSHVDQERTADNERGGDGGFSDDPSKAVQHNIDSRKVRFDKRNTTPVTSLVLSASNAYFEIDSSGRANPKKLDAWKRQSMKFLREEFGDDLAHVSLHLDEKTPHLHAKVVPTYEKKTKKGTVSRFGSHHKHKAFGGYQDENGKWRQSKRSYAQLLDRYAAAVRPLGIHRGEALPEGSKGNHRTARQWVEDMARRMANPAAEIEKRDADFLAKQQKLEADSLSIAKEKKELSAYRVELDDYAMNVHKKAKTVAADAVRIKAKTTETTAEAAKTVAPAPKRVEKRSRRKKKTVVAER